MAHTTHSVPTTHGREKDGRDFGEIQRSEDFVKLRKSLRRFVFPMSAFFLTWYLAYVLLAAYAHEFMSRPVLGSVNVGLLLGVLQFVTTIGIMVTYLRFARAKVDRQVAAIRSRWGRTHSGGR